MKSRDCKTLDPTDECAALSLVESVYADDLESIVHSMNADELMDVSNALRLADDFDAANEAYIDESILISTV